MGSSRQEDRLVIIVQPMRVLWGISGLVMLVITFAMWADLGHAQNAPQQAASAAMAAANIVAIYGVTRAAERVFGRKRQADAEIGLAARAESHL